MIFVFSCLFFFSSRRRHTRCALVTGVQTCARPILAKGGKNLGPTPYDLLTAALGECTAITIRWYVMREGWPVEHVDVQVRHGKKLETGSNQMIDEFHKTISIVAPDLSETQRQKLFDVAGKCPIHKTLTGTIRIATEHGQ